MNKIFIFLVSVYLTACDLDLGSSFDPSTRTMYVDYYQEACNERSTSLCFRIRFNTEDAFKITQLPMTGFDDLQWGSRYTLQIEAQRDGEGNDTQYKLQGIDKSEVIDSSANSFLLTFNMGSGILLDNQNNNWIIAGEKSFSCTPEDCSSLTAASRDNQKVQLSFSVKDDQLTLLAVKCRSSEAQFSSECDGINNSVWNVAHYRSDCGIFEPRLCLIYKEKAAASTEWQLLPFDISGLTEQWGKEYQVEVEVKIEAKDLKSAKFIKEDSSVTDRVNSSFKMVMRTGASGLKVSDNEVITYNNIKFNCSRFNQCSDIDAGINRATSTQERFLILQGVVETSSDSPVILIQDLLCDAAGDVFKTECVSKHDDVYWIE